MPRFTVQDKNILFIHIPKTGGTTVLDSLSAVSAVRENWMPRPNDKDVPINHYHSEWLYSRYDFDSFDFIFSIVRHPLKRIESDFKFLTKHHSRLPKDINVFIPFVFEEYNTNPYTLDNHIRPQSHFIKDNRVTVFKFEQGISNILRHINDKLSLSIPTDKHSNKSKTSQHPISDQNVEAIRDFYREDFERFSYDSI